MILSTFTCLLFHDQYKKCKISYYNSFTRSMSYDLQYINIYVFIYVCMYVHKEMCMCVSTNFLHSRERRPITLTFTNKIRNVNTDNQSLNIYIINILFII